MHVLNFEISHFWLEFCSSFFNHAHFTGHQKIANILRKYLILMYKKRYGRTTIISLGHKENYERLKIPFVVFLKTSFVTAELDI